MRNVIQIVNSLFHPNWLRLTSVGTKLIVTIDRARYRISNGALNFFSTKLHRNYVERLRHCSRRIHFFFTAKLSLLTLVQATRSRRLRLYRIRVSKYMPGMLYVYCVYGKTQSLLFFLLFFFFSVHTFLRLFILDIDIYRRTLHDSIVEWLFCWFFVNTT